MLDCGRFADAWQSGIGQWFTRLPWRRYRRQFFQTACRRAKDSEPTVRLFVMGGGSWRYNRPGETRELRIVPPPTANLFLTGHRVRPDVSSSNFPKFDVNPNTGEAECTALRQQRAVNRVVTGPSPPGRLMLPELPE